MHLQELSDLVINQKKSLKEIEGITTTEKEVYGAVESQINYLDDTLHDLDKKRHAYGTFESLSSLIRELKVSKDPKEFKRDNIEGFMRWNKPTKDIRTIKNQYKLNTIEEVNEYPNKLKDERDILFKDYSTLTIDDSRKKQRKRPMSL